MICDGLTKQLFGTFPREGGQKRVFIADMNAMMKYLLENDGYEDCYVSVYNKDLVIDKILFDFDHIQGKPALEDSKKVYSWLVANGYSAVAIASGKKGVHIYCLLATIGTTKETLTQVTWGILKEVFGEGYTKTTADSHVIGDVRRIIRIPNTRRPDTKLWCTPLPPDYVNFTWGDIIRWTRIPHEFPALPTPTKTIMDLPKVLVRDIEVIAPTQSAQPIQVAQVNTSDTIRDKLKILLRPCLYNAIIIPHPDHLARLATATELMNLFYTPKEVHEMLEQLYWTDWDSKAMIQICSVSHYKPCKCSTLRAKNLCLYLNERDCPWIKKFH